MKRGGFTKNVWGYQASQMLILMIAVWGLSGSVAAAPKKSVPERKLQKLEIPGASPAFYFKPKKKGRSPVFIYLHGRHGYPESDCQRWSSLVYDLGWLVCPQGPTNEGEGARSWNNGSIVGRRIMEAALIALSKKYKGRVQMRGNLVIGFSEGAYIAMQVGLYDPGRWSRWLILGASDQYWLGDRDPFLQKNKKRIARVYLLTGKHDEVAPQTLRVGATLKKMKIPHHVQIIKGLGHEVALEKRASIYRKALQWLITGRS
ncbi:alpha/beta hydrolase [Pajaroellobacter abortibovis]|uniref:Phospholipase/carboxylesterase/thioesterase domain-containing protein n=1 Tax=Pajaroellobacter abortibovis TaxID=1882918 RepID=A0A1L6MV78_9BACT|nr:hypothetical protein [Pajaroellobacter abortibovis]APR99396.1 hypothetical protein BCY86_00900 [Pajaroellobacter abortibovis]